VTAVTERLGQHARLTSLQSYDGVGDVPLSVMCIGVLTCSTKLTATECGEEFSEYAHSVSEGPGVRTKQNYE
jgi:hypothetical protein